MDSAIQPDGRIIGLFSTTIRIPGCIPSKTTICDRPAVFMRRYNPNLTIDKKFRGGAPDVAVPGPFFGNLLIESDSSFLVFFNGISRYSSGFLSGQFPPPFPPAKIARASDGKIASCFSSPGPNTIDTNIALYSPDGSLIGTDTNRDWFDGDDLCAGLAFQPDGKLLVGSTGVIGTPNVFQALRYASIIGN